MLRYYVEVRITELKVDADSKMTTDIRESNLRRRPFDTKEDALTAWAVAAEALKGA